MRARCKCWRPLPVRQAAKAALAEIKEFNAEPTLDELDDVKVCLNRLVGSFVKKTTIEVFTTPFYDLKVTERMNSYGCIRSERHLKDGRCPSLTD